MIPNASSSKPAWIDLIPEKLVLFIASPYLAGDTDHRAIELAHQIYQSHHFVSTVDILGEACQTLDDCDGFVLKFLRLIDCIARRPLAVTNSREQLTVSMKPSMFSVAVPNLRKSGAHLDDAYLRIRKVVDYARTHQIGITLEAEDHLWTDFQLETYFSLVREGYSNVGTVVQSRLFRSREDIRRFDERMRVRLVIGIYNERSDIALTEKPLMKQSLLELADELAQRGTYIELGTHDAGCLYNFFARTVMPRSIPTSQFETQWLLGVPRKNLQKALVTGKYFEGWDGDNPLHARELKEKGVLVRLYLPFGEPRMAGAYCKRRLKANPNIITYGIKNLFNLAG